MKATLGLAVALCVMVAACGGAPSLTSYAAEIEELVATMNARLDQVEAESTGTQDMDTIKWYAHERAAARDAFVEAMGGLEPPDSVTELHANALDIMAALAEAESALADRVDSMATAAGIDAIWSTPEGTAAQAANQQAVDLCYAAQAELDRTQARTDLGDVSWMPADMKEVVRVAFGCEPPAPR